jgi:hypothetical protein
MSDKIFFTFYDSDTTELNHICAGLASGCTPDIDLTDIPLPGSDLVAGGCTSNCADTDPRFWVTTATTQLGALGFDFNSASTMWGVTFCNGRDGVVDGVTQCFDGAGGAAITATCPNILAPHTGDCTWAAKNIRQGFASLVNKAAFTIQDVGAIGPNAVPMDHWVTPVSNALHSGYPNDVNHPNIPPGVCDSSGTGPNCNPTGPYCVTPGDTGSLSGGAGNQAVACSTPGAYSLGGVCSWDALVGCTQTALSAFHYFNDVYDSNGFNLPPCGGTLPACPANPQGATVNLGRDFCRAADHFIAAGLATGKNSQCELTGETTQLTAPAVPVVFKGRASLGRLQTSLGYTASVCELINLGSTSCPLAQFTEITIGLGTAHAQVFRTGCKNGAADGGSCKTQGPNTPNNGLVPFAQSWNLYAAGNFFPLNIPNSLWAGWTSSFYSNYCGGAPSEEGGQYQGVCNPTFDTWATQTEFNGSPPAAIAALQVAMDIFGNHTYQVTIWTPSIQYPYVKGWQGVSNSAGIGTAQGNPWSLQNMWTANPKADSNGVTLPSTIRWGQKDNTASLNVYTFSSVVETDLVGSIYDSLMVTNPFAPTQIVGYMVSFYQKVLPGAAGCPTTYTNTRGTFTVGACVKMVLRGDNYFHDILDSATGCTTASTVACVESHQVTASDVKFSYLSYNATGAFCCAGGTANTIDIVYNPNQLPGVAYGASGGTNSQDSGESLTFYLHANNAWALTDIAGLPIIPQRIWSCQGNTTGTPCVNVHKQPNNGYGQLLQPCINIDTPACIGEPARLTADPVTSGLLIGSGPWVCANKDLSIQGSGGVTVGTGCTSNNSQSPGFGGTATLRRFSLDQGLTTTGTLYSLNPHFSYFRTSGKFLQENWANFLPTPSTGVTASDRISLTHACLSSATAVGGEVSYTACQHWNSTSALVSPCLGPAGTPCLGVAPAAPAIKSCTTVSCAGLTGLVTQVNQWIGRSAGGSGNAFTWGVPGYGALSGAQGLPPTLYDDGNSEGSIVIAATPTVSISNSTTAPAVATVSLSGGPDNNFTGTVPITVICVSQAGISCGPSPQTPASLTPAAPSQSVTFTIGASIKNGTYNVFIRAATAGMYVTATVSVTVHA